MLGWAWPRFRGPIWHDLPGKWIAEGKPNHEQERAQDLVVRSTTIHPPGLLIAYRQAEAR